MKEFNLDEYLKNPSRKVVTRDGYPVKIMCTNFNMSGYPIVAEIDDKEYRTKQSWTFNKNGQYDLWGKSHRKDLFFAPEKHEGWINLYKNEDGISWISPNYFTSKKEAEKEGKTHTCSVTTIKIEWEE